MVSAVYREQCPRGNRYCGFLRGEGCSLEAACCELDSLSRKLDALKARSDA